MCSLSCKQSEVWYHMWILYLPLLSMKVAEKVHFRRKVWGELCTLAYQCRLRYLILAMQWPSRPSPSDLRNPPPPHNLPKAKSQLLMERGRGGAIEWSLGGGGGMGVYEVRYGSAQVAGEKKRYGSAAARRRSKNCHRTSADTCTNPS